MITKIMDYLKSAFQIIILNKREIHNVSEDKNSTIPAIIFLILGSIIITAFGSIATIFDYYQDPDFILIFLKSYLKVILMVLVGLLIIHILARVFGGKNQFISLFRPSAFSIIFSLILLLRFAPGINLISDPLILIWTFFIDYNIIKEIYRLSRTLTVIILLINIFVTLLI